MSGGGGSRFSIPASVRRTIQNIKEIAGHHSDDDIYAMLKECAMDPNETAQKLLLQDTFHEVKRKRDKRMENVREHADPRWRSGALGRGGRGGRENYSLCYLSNDADGRNITSGKENGVNQGPDKGNASFSSNSTGIENKSTTSISSTVSGIANGPFKTDILLSSQGCLSQVSGDSGITSREKSSAEAGVHVSAADPVIVPSVDAHRPGEMATIKHVIQSQETFVEMAVSKVASHDVFGSDFSSSRGKGSTEVSSSYVHGESQVKSQGSEANQLSGASQVASSSSYRGPTGSRSSSNYGNRSQQLVGSQKVVSNKEWKPKSTHTNPTQASGIPCNSNVPMTGDAISQSVPVPASCSVDSEETISKLEKKLDELHRSARQHVIIPNHLQVPDSERHGLSFGSFDACFNFDIGFANGHASDKNAAQLSGSSHEIEENVEQPSSSIHTGSSAAQEADHPDHPQSPTQIPENYSLREADISGISATEEYDQAKQEPVLAPEDPKDSGVPSIPSNSTFGLVPQMLGSQFASFESSEPQTCDTTHLPNFVVQQPFDLSSSIYTQFYRPPTDADGRLSPFLAPGGFTKYNGNMVVVPTQTGQSQQESGSSVVLSTAGSTPLATQAVVAMQSSIAIPQHPVPVFQQSAGVHLSHYPIPYSQYFSPFYVPPPTLHPFLSSVAFPQQPPVGSMFPPPGAAAASNPVKFSPQYKPGVNIGTSTLIGMPAGYGTYNSTSTGYTPSPIVSSGNSTGNEDLNSTQFKENNIYNSLQQSESSAVWIPAPGRDISNLQASSFYSIPPQGRHMTFAPTQTGHGAFSGIYHPAPAAAVHPLVQQSQTGAGAVEMVGPSAGVYQQPHHAQINWTNNY